MRPYVEDRQSGKTAIQINTELTIWLSPTLKLPTGATHQSELKPIDAVFPPFVEKPTHPIVNNSHLPHNGRRFLEVYS